MGDESYKYPVALMWDRGPDSLKQLKNKLLLHFQSKNKSNGGECEIRDWDCSRGQILIHFRDEGVRDQVLQKNDHELKITKEQTINLMVTLPKSTEEPQPNPNVETATGGGEGAPEASMSQVLIENVQESSSSAMLTTLVENISKMDANKDFSVEMVPELSAAIITFTGDTDIHHFIRSFSSSLRVTQLKLKARPLEDTTSIRVEDLPPNTDEQHLTFYFESPRLGGGTVQEIVMLPEEGAALLKLCDPEVVKTILKTPHVFNKTAICVYPYYPSLNIHLYGPSGPHVTTPPPREFTISPYILEYVLNNEQIRLSIDRKMEDKHCKIQWPNLDCQNPTIRIEMSEALSTRTMAKVVRTWTEKVSAEFSLIISRYKVIDCKMNPSAWDDIKKQISTAAYDGVLVKASADAEKVFLAGAMKDVNKMEQTFRKMVEEISRKAERNSQLTTKTEAMSAALYNILCNSGLEKRLLAEAPELKMEYDLSTRNIRITGLQGEVLEAKCEILRMTQQLKSKSIQPDPHVLQFLMSTDNDELSCLLFVRHNINAIIEVEENAIKLTGYTKQDLVDAQEKMSQEIICQRIPVDERSVLRGAEWLSLRSHLLQSLNTETCTVTIQEAEKEVLLAGLASNVHKSYKSIHEFVEKNTPMQKTIQVKSMAVMQFIKEEKQRDIDELKKINVRVTLRNRNIHLMGTKSYVEEAASYIQKVLSSLHCQTLRIDKPGAKKHYLSHEEMYVSLVKNNYKCVISLQKEEEEDDDILNEASPDEPQYRVDLPQGVTISVYSADLCRHNADVIVNAANEDLKHIGGLAKALLDAAGPKLQADCDQIVRQQGRLFPGESVITDGGNLPCKQVIHTVGPRWNSMAPQRCSDLLQTAISKSLALAAKHGHGSIAIPAVSSGIFGFPVPVCTQNIVEAIKEFVEIKGRSSSVTNIYLVDTKDETITAFIKSLKEQFRDQNLPRSHGRRAKETEPQRSEEGATAGQKIRSEEPQRREQGATAGQMIRSQNMNIRVQEGLLQDTITDVMVNSVGKDLRLDSGGASRALHDKAGDQLQELLSKEASRAQVADGSTFVTSGCKLSCAIVIHVVLPSWDGGKGSSEKIFRRTIQTCLDLVERRQLTSITFPAIGTGVLGFPRSLVATLMFEEVLNFSKTPQNQFLKEVTFMLHPNDKETIKEFTKEINARKTTYPAASDRKIKPTLEAKPNPPVISGTNFFGVVKTPNLGFHEMRIGSLTYQVKTGDITKEDTDIIVNSTDQVFNLRSGVSKAILEAAGPLVQNECALLASQNKKSSHITTQGGNLLCKHILHVHGRNTAEGIKDFVAEALQECGKLQVASVAFPAIGTGLGNVASGLVADIILEAVTEFANSKPSQSLQMVKVVIYQQEMLQDFYASMKKKEGTDLPKQTSLLSRMANSVISFFTSNPTEDKEPKVFELRENIEPAIFHLCADTSDGVTGASRRLEDLILKEQHENLITDDWILEFDQQDHHTLSQDQRRLEVFVSFESPGSMVKIIGLTRDVLEMTNKIQNMIKKVRVKKTKEREAELCSNLVEWRYFDGTKFVPFDRMTNLDLEKAKNTKTQNVTIDLAGVTYTVVMELKSMLDPRGNKKEIERVSKHGHFELPTHWTQMTGDVTVVKIMAGTPEYNLVEAQFKKTCQMRIVNIERIQNKNLWMNYQIKKQAIDSKNGTTSNERQLFHGTDVNTITTVNHNGFNRSYAGRNAACYGNGTYFAVNSNYSAHDQYSKPDPNGLKYMYLARVLTGEFCAGRQGMVAPPTKNASNITDLYDSVTDNPANPTMFVIFHDIQAYPEYLITFSK